METFEAVFAMLEIVAVMLPLSLIALGLIVSWLRETDDARVLGPDMALTVGDMAGFTLMLLSGAGIALSFQVMGHGPHRHRSKSRAYSPSWRSASSAFSASPFTYVLRTGMKTMCCNTRDGLS